MHVIQNKQFKIFPFCIQLIFKNIFPTWIYFLITETLIILFMYLFVHFYLGTPCFLMHWVPATGSVGSTRGSVPAAENRWLTTGWWPPSSWLLTHYFKWRFPSLLSTKDIFSGLWNYCNLTSFLINQEIQVINTE